MAKRLELNLKFNDPQMRAYRALFDEHGHVCRRRSVFAGWGRGVGKTQFARIVWYLLVAAFDGKVRHDALTPFRGVRITSMAPTLKQWKDINWGGVEEELGPHGQWAFLKAKLDRQSGQVRFPGGSIIRPFPATVYNSRTSRGLRTDVIDAEEFDDIDSEVYDGVAVPWLSEPWSLGIELLRGTPTRGRHGLWYRTLQTGKLAERIRNGEMPIEEALKQPQAQAVLDVFLGLPWDQWPADLPKDPEQAALAVLSNFYSFHATYRDAPETVSPLAVARAKANTPESTFEREWEANPDAGEGLVFSTFREDFHVRTPPDLRSFREFHAGMDHGSTDPGAMSLVGVKGRGDERELWVLAEHYEANAPNHVWNQRAKDWQFAKIWPDTSRPDRIQDLRALELTIGETDRGPGSILAGISKINDLLFIRTPRVPKDDGTVNRFARLYVSATCKNLIKELGKYRYPKLPDGSFGETPLDKNNHLIDGLRYVVTGIFGRPETGRSETAGR